MRPKVNSDYVLQKLNNEVASGVATLTPSNLEDLGVDVDKTCRARGGMVVFHDNTTIIFNGQEWKPGPKASYAYEK